MPTKVTSQLPVTPHCNFLWKLPFKIQRPRTLESAVGIGCFRLPGRSPDPSWADHLSPGDEEFKSNRQGGSIYGCPWQYLLWGGIYDNSETWELHFATWARLQRKLTCWARAKNMCRNRQARGKGRERATLGGSLVPGSSLS